MKQLIKGFSGWSLNRKFTLIIFLIVFVPIMVLSSLLFGRIRETLMQEKMMNVRLDLEQTRMHVANTVDVCRITAQALSGNARLWDYLHLILSDEPNGVNTIQSLDFFRNDILNLNQMIYTNPYLYGIRLYIDSDTMPEMMPILYRLSRMERLAWAADAVVSKRWHFDYTDTLFPSYVNAQTPHLMGLVMPLRDASGEVAGVIETATRMDVMLPGLFSTDESQFLCLIDSEGRMYYNRHAENPWHANAEALRAAADSVAAGTAERLMVESRHIALASCAIPELDGQLVLAVSLEPEIAAINRQIVLFFGILALALIALVFAINGVVRRLLRRFNALLGAIAHVREGNLQIQMPDGGNDEIHVLSVEIDRMLDMIHKLMHENTQRVLLAKNSELRALQNQINAHFLNNVLESIKMMAEVDERYDIANALTALGKMLRYTVRWVSDRVTVAEEIAYIRGYVELMNLRNDFRIYLSLRIPDAVLTQRIPKMSLQPIIENAIEHGLEPIAKDGCIYIKAVLTPDACRIEITDLGRGLGEDELALLKQRLASDGASYTGEDRGVGLKNVHERLRLAYGEAFGLEVISRRDFFTKIIVRIPPCADGEARNGYAADCGR